MVQELDFVIWSTSFLLLQVKLENKILDRQMIHSGRGMDDVTENDSQDTVCCVLIIIN